MDGLQVCTQMKNKKHMGRGKTADTRGMRKRHSQTVTAPPAANNNAFKVLAQTRHEVCTKINKRRL